MNITENDCAVKIAVRERPLREIFQNNQILVVDGRIFAFDHVLSPSISQEELFKSLVLPLVGKVLNGFHCTAFAYGQTGTGKSFTMGLNPESIDGINVGIIPRCVQAILDNNTGNGMKKYEISASFIEIYSEKVFDLLGDNPSEPIIARDDSVFSIKSLNDARRRSIRLMSHKGENEESKETQTDKLTTSKKTNKRGKKPAGSLIQNHTIAGYSEMKQNQKKSTNLKTNLAKDQKAILEMLNTASMKQLQYLPQIGLKTALHIVTQRTLHGKFKSFKQVSKLPIWRGTGWERFKEINSIS